MNTLYDQDFYLWTQKMSELIKNRQFDAVDWENIVEEIETLGRSEKRAVKSHLVILLLHLLKWQYQPEYRCRSWSASTNNARRQLQKLLKENPSLATDFLVESVPVAYEEAREKASEETTIYLENFPIECPYSIEEIKQKNWLPN